MERFLERHQDRIMGVISGFDRVLFRGTLRSISYLKGMDIFLSSQRVLYKHFGTYAERLSKRIKDHAETVANKQKRPFEYLASSAICKEDRAQAIVKRDRIREGLVCVLSCVEPCQTYRLRRDRASQHLLLTPAERKCLHLYFYFVHKDFGLMHVRLQTWLPFTIQVCINGREYLARQMDRAGIGYEQRDNCFVRIDDLPRAQILLDGLTRRPWPRFLNALARRVNPWINPQTGLDLHGYYWTVRQGEYATDVLFRDAASLQAIYPGLVAHAMQSFSCQDVLRFLGRYTNSRFNGQVSSDIQSRAEGVRIKHRVEENSIKMYDKQGSVLRIETTINNTRRFKVRRLVTRKGKRCLGWVPMRKGLADLGRRVQVSLAANCRYLQALAVVGQPQPVASLLDPISRRVVHKGRSYRPLRPLTAEETRLFAALLRGEFQIQGFRNAQVRHLLYPESTASPICRRQQSGRVTRLFRLLRAHGLIRKVPTTRYYRATHKGNQVMATAIRLRQTDLALLAA